MGAQRKALNNIKANYEVAGLAEWYVPAIITYEAIHNNLKINKTITREEAIAYLETKTLSMDSKKPVASGYWSRKDLNKLRIIYSAVKASEDSGNIFDVRTLHERKLEDVDLLTYSFPCQDLSQQGKGKGMTKGDGTRSGLLWEIEKALDTTSKDKLPKYLLMENVMALVNYKNKPQLDMWIKKLESLGYKNDVGVLNAGDFGSSQARRRVFMISSFGTEIKLPIGDKKPQPMNKILNKETRVVDFMTALDKFSLSEFKNPTKSNIKKKVIEGYSTFHSETYVYDPKHTGPTLTASGANSRIKISTNTSIRKMNPEEAYRYMGFKTSDYKKVHNINILRELEMIFTCGNSISVEVLEEIFKEVMYE